MARSLPERTVDAWVAAAVVAAFPDALLWGPPFTFQQFVEDEGVYFHPLASGWPTTPANFLAFRWGGNVQRVHRVASHKVIPTLQDLWPSIPVNEVTARPHVVHELAPPLRFERVENERVW